ncbi:MAG: hypothetical protein C0404_08435 [Verrucomicrobia bacterium]|nr:hypothetical protein [Verrucomicrobiota bacterium]
MFKKDGESLPPFLMQVGESFGDPKEFHVTRSGEAEATVRSGLLAKQMPGEIEVNIRKFWSPRAYHVVYTADRFSAP